MDDAARLDEVDRRIIAELEADGRLSVRALAERIPISRAAAYTRLERLTGSSVVTGFTVLTDPAAMGLTTSAYVTMTVRQSAWRELRERLREIPEIHHMALVGGEFDVILLVRTTDNDALRRLVLERLQDMPGVLGTRTSLIFEDLENRPRRTDRRP
ncbi:AsnC family transcriptional regulator [Pseudonocardia sediminis]|uniref:AsnC family transcriptional regulator n=1 Tax=Pseudonocardia sediminis TaxID=1397368 RepID=A0A4Q7UZR0_PSEST|nr:Lrp/AsnC family transcriptional regulator [Pseudonocardia sediminis]RZT85689.1 AsnC family transcriptional regulator [Pseudonocardia sediminis]